MNTPDGPSRRKGMRWQYAALRILVAFGILVWLFLLTGGWEKAQKGYEALQTYTIIIE